MEEKIYVSGDNLKQYDPLMKAWMEEQVDSVPIMDIVYDEDNRVLEFTERNMSMHATINEIDRLLGGDI